MALTAAVITLYIGVVFSFSATLRPLAFERVEVVLCVVYTRRGAWKTLFLFVLRVVVCGVVLFVLLVVVFIWFGVVLFMFGECSNLHGCKSVVLMIFDRSLVDVCEAFSRVSKLSLLVLNLSIMS